MTSPQDALEELLGLVRGGRADGHVRIDDLAQSIRDALPAEGRWMISAPREPGIYWAKDGKTVAVVRVAHDESGILRVENFGTERADRIDPRRQSPVRWWSAPFPEPPA